MTSAKKRLNMQKTLLDLRCAKSEREHFDVMMHKSVWREMRAAQGVSE